MITIMFQLKYIRYIFNFFLKIVTSLVVLKFFSVFLTPSVFRLFLIFDKILQGNTPLKI